MGSLIHQPCLNHLENNPTAGHFNECISLLQRLTAFHFLLFLLHPPRENKMRTTTTAPRHSYLSAISEVIVNPATECEGMANSDMGEARMDIIDSEINREWATQKTTVRSARCLIVCTEGSTSTFVFTCDEYRSRNTIKKN